MKRVNREFTQANHQELVMKGMNFKSSATQTDDRKGLIALEAVNYQAGGVNAVMPTQSVSGRQVDGISVSSR